VTPAYSKVSAVKRLDIKKVGGPQMVVAGGNSGVDAGPLMTTLADDLVICKARRFFFSMVLVSFRLCTLLIKLSHASAASVVAPRLSFL
jgi:hypothetical protein